LGEDERPNGPYDVAILSAAEARNRLELLSEVSTVVDAATGDYEEAARKVAAVCVPAFADLCAIELVGKDGELQPVAYRVDRGRGLLAPREWRSIGRAVLAGAGPVLDFDGGGGDQRVALARRSLNAESLIVAPIAEGGITLGRLVVATGPRRRAFRPSALRTAAEVASRLAAAVQRATLHQEMQAASREQERAVRRLRHLAAAAAHLAGAASTKEVLEVACREACFIQGVGGAAARWWMPDGTAVEAQAGVVDPKLAEQAFEATAGRQFARERAWLAYPLMPNQVRQRAALVLLVDWDLSYDEELVLSSLASLVPVAFERAEGTGAALAQEARVQAVVSSSPVALVGLGPTGLVTLANPAAQRLFGWEPGPGPAAAVLPPSLQPVFRELAGAVHGSGTVADRVVSAEPFELSLSAAPMPAISGGGDELSVLVAATDLSDVKRAERALVQAQRLDAMGLVAGRVAHDFNNLLTVIIGYTELLERNSGRDVQRLSVANINIAARRAASLTQQLLGLTGGQRDAATAVDLATELRELRPVLERLSRGTVSVRIGCPDEPVVVAMSPSEAQQVILNLAFNACQAMEEGGGALDIQLTTLFGQDVRCGQPPAGATGAARGDDRSWAVFSVADDGRGMSEEVRARCLEPFFTTKARGQGSGLGLPTVHALVSEAGGRLDIESAPGHGTTVTVRLPISQDAPITSETETVEAWPAGVVLSGRALLVEDEDELRELTARALSEAGLQVTSSDSAEGAVRTALGAEPFDVLVTDIMLPGRSGLDLAHDLGAGVEGLPVLFVTGFSQAAGPLPRPGPHVQVLHKPYRPEELVFALAALLGGEPVPS
jgi:signal transduction histidine kinase